MAAPYSHAPLAKKLVVRSNTGMLAIASPTSYRTLLGELPANTTYAETAAEFASDIEGMFDWIHLFLTTRADLERQLPVAKLHLRPEGVFWVSFPRTKQATDLNRTLLMKIVQQFGLQPVSNVVVDDDWTAYRLKPVEGTK